MRLRLGIVSLALLSVFSSVASQELSEVDRDEIFFTYFALEHVWNGPWRIGPDSTNSRFRVLSQIAYGRRLLIIEHLAVSTLHSLNNQGADMQTTLLSRHYSYDEHFDGPDTPEDTSLSLNIESWLSASSFIMTIGDSRYRLRVSDFGVEESSVLDDNDNVIAVPRWH